MRSPRQFRGSTAAITLAAVGIGAALAPSTALAKTKVKVAPGYYADLALKSTPSTSVELTVTKSGTVKEFAVVCGATSPTEEATTENDQVSDIAVWAPTLQLNKSGGFSYNGPASVSASGVKGKIGSTTLIIRANYVDKPTVHYTFEGNHLSATRIFVGTVSTPACITATTSADPFGDPLYKGGQFQVFN
jgi:hypothetical protein